MSNSSGLRGGIRRFMKRRSKLVGRRANPNNKETSLDGAADDECTDATSSGDERNFSDGDDVFGGDGDAAGVDTPKHSAESDGHRLSSTTPQHQQHPATPQHQHSPNHTKNAEDPLFLRSMSESSFNCGCCYELMIQPTTLNCGHSFCRLCLARWWKSVKKTTCPGCRQPWVGFPHINIILR